MLTQAQRENLMKARQLVTAALADGSEGLPQWILQLARASLSGEQMVTLGDRIARDGHMKQREGE